MNKLPKPTGYRILVKPREILNKTKGGIILTDESRDAAKFSCVISQVIDMGPVTGKYVGLKFKYENEEYSIINDDEVVAIIPDPDKISAK